MGGGAGTGTGRVRRRRLAEAQKRAMVAAVGTSDASCWRRERVRQVWRRKVVPAVRARWVVDLSVRTVERIERRVLKTVEGGWLECGPALDGG